MRYFRIRSWHIVKSEFTSRGGFQMATAFCGRTRTITDPVSIDDLPLDEKSCETCLRIAHVSENE